MSSTSVKIKSNSNKPLTLNYLNKTIPARTIVNIEKLNTEQIAKLRLDYQKGFISILGGLPRAIKSEVKKSQHLEPVTVEPVTVEPVTVEDNSETKNVELDEVVKENPIVEEKNLTNTISSLSIAEIKKRILEGKLSIKDVLDAENSGKQRSSLIQWIKQL